MWRVCLHIRQGVSRCQNSFFTASIVAPLWLVEAGTQTYPRHPPSSSSDVSDVKPSSNQLDDLGFETARPHEGGQINQCGNVQQMDIEDT